MEKALEEALRKRYGNRPDDTLRTVLAAAEVAHRLSNGANMIDLFRDGTARDMQGKLLEEEARRR